MSEHMYKVVEVIGTSSESWEKAAASVVAEAGKHLKDLRVATVDQLDMQIAEGRVVQYRARVRLSFKYHGKADETPWSPE